MTIEHQYGEGFIHGSVMEMISGKEYLHISEAIIDTAIQRAISIYEKL
jgi:hypothetical protein